MNIELALMLADEASIVLICDNPSFDGDQMNAAEYIYFKALRENLVEPEYWIQQASDILEIRKWMDLENATQMQQTKEDEDERDKAVRCGADNKLDAPV